MSSSLFRVITHQIPCAHLREFPRATTDSEEEVLRLCVKQYVPLDNPSPQPGDVTILATHANAFPKEMYEPLWDELISRAKQHGWRIRSIWMADVAWQGESGMLNEQVLGNDPNWNDHPRDLMNLVNLKRDEMPRPIVGIGHSMGGAHLVKLSSLHPSLFTTLILLDAVVQPSTAEASATGSSLNMAQASTFRRATWPSRAEAKKALLRSPFYLAWDPRCLDKYISYGLRDCPNHAFPDLPAPHVSLATPVGQEVWTYMRPNFDRNGVDGNTIDRVTHPDLDIDQPHLAPFYRAEPFHAYKSLETLRPSCMYVFGGTSPVNDAELCEAKVQRTGIGPGGSGGGKEGRVKGLTFEGMGHLFPMEDPSKTAEVVVDWVGAEIGLYRQRNEFWRKEWWSKDLKGKQEIDKAWKDAVGGPIKRRKAGSKI